MSVAIRRSRSGWPHTFPTGWLIVILLAAGLLGSGIRRVAVADDIGKQKPNDANLALRPYRDGPLTAADFRCPPPNPLPQKHGVLLSAMTYTSLHYNTRYHWQEMPQQKIQVRLTQFDIVAQIDRRQSWTTRPTDDRLLDHEQGHFDVTEMWARRIQDKFTALISSGAIVGHGDDRAAAIADLNHQVDARVHVLLDQEQKAQAQYDLETRHGTDHKAQADYRRIQITALQYKPAPPPKETLTQPSEPTN